jgi:hypothetical protein
MKWTTECTTPPASPPRGVANADVLSGHSSPLCAGPWRDFGQFTFCHEDPITGVNEMNPLSDNLDVGMALPLTVCYTSSYR